MYWFGFAVGSDSMETVKSVFGRWRSAVGEATKKAEDLAGNTWQHCEFRLAFLSFLVLNCDSLSFGLIAWI